MIAGLIQSTKDGLRPLHRPVIPSSERISRNVEVMEEEDFESCCRVAMTDTGIVKSCAKAAASAPNASSVLIEPH